MSNWILECFCALQHSDYKISPAALLLKKKKKWKWRKKKWREIFMPDLVPFVEQKQCCEIILAVQIVVHISICVCFIIFK